MEMDRLAAQNPWWGRREAITEDEKVVKVLETGEKIAFELGEGNQVLIGPRQLGKTTALKYDIYRRIMREGADPGSILYYTFDTSRSFEDVADVISTFAERDGTLFLYLDEVGFVDQWQRAIKGFLDSQASRKATLYVTGSSSINLKKELMPGRGIRFKEFLPLSFREFVSSFGSGRLREAVTAKAARDLNAARRAAESMATHFAEIQRLFGMYMSTGGYPDAIFDYMERGSVSDELYDTHWNAFVSDVSKAGRSVEISTAIVYGILESYASKINLSGIARMQGVKSHVTVREYLETFEDLFVASSIFPVAGRRYAFRKERKVYFSDPFLYGMFARKANFADRERESKVAEGILYNHLHRFANRGRTLAEPKTAIGFHSGKREVDFVIGGTGIELKWRDKVGVEDFPEVGINDRLLLSKKTLKNEGKTVILPLPLFLAAL